LNQEGSIIAFATFEDFPQVSSLLSFTCFFPICEYGDYFGLI
jgi:hypothetical protein